MLSKHLFGNLELFTKLVVCAAHSFGKIEGFSLCFESVESWSDVLVVVHFEEEGKSLLILVSELELVFESHLVLERCYGAHEDIGMADHKVLHIHVGVGAVFL